MAHTLYSIIYRDTTIKQWLHAHAVCSSCAGCRRNWILVYVVQRNKMRYNIQVFPKFHEVAHKVRTCSWYSSAWEGKADWCSINSDVDVVPDHCGKRSAKLIFHSIYLWSHGHDLRVRRGAQSRSFWSKGASWGGPGIWWWVVFGDFWDSGTSLL